MKNGDKDKMKRVNSAAKGNGISEKDFNKFCHDLKNPLTTIKMHIEFIASALNGKEKTREVDKMMKVVVHEVDKMAKMLSKDSK